LAGRRVKTPSGSGITAGGNASFSSAQTCLIALRSEKFGASSAFSVRYSIFRIGVVEVDAAEWLFPQEKATLHAL
jgi:lysozyme family protein